MQTPHLVVPLDKHHHIKLFLTWAEEISHPWLEQICNGHKPGNESNEVRIYTLCKGDTQKIAEGDARSSLCI